jgi:hypothetical protein
MVNAVSHAASFRDPSGFLFRQDGSLYRQVNQVYREHYQHLMDSGLFSKLVGAGLLIDHQEVELAAPRPEIAYKVIQPELIPFISYPYEWSFSQLKDAALLTLDLHQRARQHGMVLKDASAYNIQFRAGRPVLVDSLSFEIAEPDQPWVAYRQFCQHFLAPLALMTRKDVRLSQLLRVYIDGCPLDLASKLLPRSSYLNFGLLSHIHLHARAQSLSRRDQLQSSVQTRKSSANAQQGLLNSLQATISKLDWQPRDTDWLAYYEATNYSQESFEAKKDLVAKLIRQVEPGVCWDLGANTGVFSRLAIAQGALTISLDYDPGAVEVNYRQMKAEAQQDLLPLCIDLTNPSPAIGWENLERHSFLERGPVDLVLALALIHHLVIANNVPLPKLAAFFAGLSEWLLIEFVPKADSQVQRMLAARVDIFSDYTEAGFESAFGEYFELLAQEAVPDTQRRLYLFRRQNR